MTPLTQVLEEGKTRLLNTEFTEDSCGEMEDLLDNLYKSILTTLSQEIEGMKHKGVGVDFSEYSHEATCNQTLSDVQSLLKEALEGKQ